MPRLAFVVPVFEPDITALNRCFKSLAEQSLKDIEVVVVMDGPCPEAEPIVRKYFTSAKIVTIEHAGACAARNEGFKHTTADLVCFWDCDSAIEREAAKAWVEIFDAKPDVGFVYAGYRWFDENRPGYDSEEFDPWLLRVNNYISTCFPVRRQFVGRWNEALKSLQDWDFWLSVVEKGAKGHFMQGFAFQTALPTARSISGQGCTEAAWLERIDTVRKLHNIPQKTVCVSSIASRHEGIRLAKLIDADYRDFPLVMPNHYKTVIQIGFSFQPTVAEQHSSVFGKDTKNILFWTAEDVSEVYNAVGRKALLRYAELLNKISTQYVEDKEAQRIMDLCGFQTKVLPLPLVNMDAIDPLPEKPLFLLDIAPEYSEVFNALERSLPDVKLEFAHGAVEIKKYTGLVHFKMDPTLTQTVKRMLVNGRYVISNIQQPFTGFVEDKQPPDTFIPEFVEKIRAIKNEVNEGATKYYSKALAPSQLCEVLGVA